MTGPPVGWRGQAWGWYAVRRTRRTTPAVQARPAAGPPPGGMGGSCPPSPLDPRKTGAAERGCAAPAAVHTSLCGPTPHSEGARGPSPGSQWAPRAQRPHLTRPRAWAAARALPKGGAPDPHPARRPARVRGELATGRPRHPQGWPGGGDPAADQIPAAVLLSAARLLRPGPTESLGPAASPWPCCFRRTYYEVPRAYCELRARSADSRATSALVATSSFFRMCET